jgi:hypothetical protein
MRKIKALALLVILLVSAGGTLAAKDKPSVQGHSLAVGSQYDGAHVYLAPEDLDRFSASIIATFAICTTPGIRLRGGAGRTRTSNQTIISRQL